MKIGVDIQSLQSTSKNRGIGRYNFNLLSNILKQNQEHYFKLFYNKNYDDLPNLEENKNAELIGIDYLDSDNESSRTANQIVQFFKYYEQDLDLFFCLSTFEGWPLNTSIINPNNERLGCLLATIIFDFIPLHYPDFYLNPNPTLKDAIYKRLKVLYHSDILFAISEWTRQDAINLLGLNPKKVINLRGGTSKDFYKIENLSTQTIQKIKKKYHIREKFVLYVSGIEFRKNLEKSLLAFSKIEETIREALSFVIVCNINDYDKKRLTDLSKKYGIEKNVVFTGFVSDEEINILYNCCDVFVFPSLMEGLGIPLLEAMSCGSPVIGSNTSSMKEIIGNEKFMFDPENEDEIASLISKMLREPPFREDSIKNSLLQTENFSWEKSAKLALSSLENMSEFHTAYKIKKPKIAFFCPLPPKKSGISFYCASLLPLLSRFWDIDLFIDEGYFCNDPFIVTNFDIYSYLEFENQNNTKNYDSIIYQIGNSDNHIYMFDMLQKHPGIVVLHDVYLSGIMYWMTARFGKLDEFVKEIEYSHGDEGLKLVSKAKKNLISWDKVINKLQINKRVLDAATSIIVHSDWDKQNILNTYPQFSEKVSTVHQFAPIRIIDDKDKIKQSLGFSKDSFLICSFGFIAPTKKIDSIIRNISNFLKSNKNASYVLVGEADNTYGKSIKDLVTEMQLQDKVIFTEFINDENYKKYLDACDVCISLRTDTRAGTSASINHALGSGLPTIISDEGPFSEFPDAVVMKIKPNEEKKLGAMIESLYSNPEKSRNLGIAAKKYAMENISKDSCVEKYVKIVDKQLAK